MSETISGLPFDGGQVHDEGLHRFPREAREGAAGGTRAFRNPWADGLFRRMAADLAPSKTAEELDRLSTLLFASIREVLTAQGERPPAPVAVLRGGLLMLEAARNAFGLGPWGFLLPGSRGRGEPVAIERVDLPVVPPGESLLLIDTIVNTGETVLATLAAFERLGIDASPGSVRLACVFLTERGERAIRSRHPRLEIYTVWSGMTVESDGWVSGVGFDAGDCAVGGGKRLQWIAD